MKGILKYSKKESRNIPKGSLVFPDSLFCFKFLKFTNELILEGFHCHK